MSSNSLLPNKYFNKLAVNRLQPAGGIRSNNVESLTPSYLFSLVFKGTFERNSESGVLTIPKNTFESGIEFTDRPFRPNQTNNFTLEEFTSLFTTTADYDSFEEDPPNGVLVHHEEQRTYEITLIEETFEYSKFNLKLLPGESHDLNTVIGRMSFFVDNSFGVARARHFDHRHRSDPESGPDYGDSSGDDDGSEGEEGFEDGI